MVEPRLLGDALATMLAGDGVDEVVEGAAISGAELDAVVVTIDLTGDAGIDVVIRLPDSSGNAGYGRVTTPRGTETVWIDDASSILELLDRYCPGGAPRRGHVTPEPPS